MQSPVPALAGPASRAICLGRGGLKKSPLPLSSECRRTDRAASAKRPPAPPEARCGQRPRSCTWGIHLPPNGNTAKGVVALCRIKIKPMIARHESMFLFAGNPPAPHDGLGANPLRGAPLWGSIFVSTRTAVFRGEENGDANQSRSEVEDPRSEMQGAQGWGKGWGEVQRSRSARSAASSRSTPLGPDAADTIYRRPIVDQIKGTQFPPSS